MSVEQNKAVVERFVAEGLNNKNIAGIMSEIGASDLVLEAPGIPTQAGKDNGYDLYQQSVQGFTDAFPDVQCKIEYIIAEGDSVSFDISYQGTHEKEFAGVAPKHEHIHGAELWFIDFNAEGKMKNVRICEYGKPLRTAMLDEQAHGVQI